MRLFSAAILLGALLLISGCAATHVPGRWAQVPPDQRATVFGTITADKSRGALSRYMIKFRNLETREEADLDINPGVDIANDGDPELYEKGRSMGLFFAIELPAGRYEFYDYFIVRQMLGGATQYRSKQPFSIPFTVEAGSINYLGEFRAYPLFVGKNIFGGLASDGGYFVVRNEEARDTEMFTKRRGSPPDKPIRKISLDLENSGTPYVRREPFPVPN